MSDKSELKSNWQRTLLYLACSTALLAGNVMAQDAEDEDETENEAPVELGGVVVTGFKQSLEAALEMKRNSVTAIDAIVAEDISDFPDLNIAESLQRIPGVAIRREGGEGRNVTVRGLGPDFNITRVNGMEGLGTTGASDAAGGANRSRQFDFNIFASELFNSVIVRKSTEAVVDEGAIGAVIDLRTARPFDFVDGFEAVINTQLEYNDLSEEASPRISGLVSKTFGDDDQFGILFAGAYSDREILEEGHSTVRWQSADWASCDACSSQADIDATNDSYHPRIPRYGRLTHKQERTGINGALQWAPSDNSEIVFEALYGTFEGSRQEQFLEALIRNEEDVMNVTDFTIDGNGTMTAGTFDNTFIRVENRFDDLETTFRQYTISGRWDVTPDLRLTSMIGTSKTDFDNPIQTTMIFDNFVDGYSYDYTGDPNRPLFDYNFDVTDPTQFLFTEVRDRPNAVTNDFDNLRLDVDWAINNNWSLVAGANYKEYGFSVTEGRRDRTVASILGAAVPVTSNLADLLTGFGSGFSLPGGIDTAWVVPDIDATAQLVNLYNQPVVARTADIRSVNEEDTAIYTQLNLDTFIGDMGFRANFGLRYYNTDLKSTGVLSGDDVTATNSYDDVLPSINVAMDLTDNIVLRGSYAQQITRPTLGSLTPGGSITVFGDPALNYGNPNLDPFMADAYDLAFEWYFNEGAIFSVAGFWKDIDSFIARLTEDAVPFNTLGLPCSVLDASPIEGQCTTPFRVSRNVNGNGGDLDGWEIALQTPFSTNDGSILSDFGLVANYTIVDSDVDYAAPGQAENRGQLTGLSENSWNLTLYYEGPAFSARISGNYRDDFLISFPDQVVEAATFWDFSSRYALNENWTLTFEAVNLTDEVLDQRHLAGDNNTSRSYVYHHTGRNFFLGARYRF